MRTLILIAIVAQLGSASIFVSPILSKVEAVQNIPIKATVGVCDEINLKVCQRNFNKYLSISSDADFQNVDILKSDIEDLLLKQNVENGLLRICQARSAFYQCLGTSYDPCMSRFHFMSAGQNLTAATAFVQIFKELEFMCNGGLIQSIQEWECIQKNRDYFKNEINKCQETFLDEMKNNPQSICENAEHLMLCNRVAYHFTCSASIGWWGCETARVALDIDDYCPHLTCSYSLIPENNGKSAVATDTVIRSKRELFQSPNPYFMRPEKMNLFIELGAKAAERAKRRKRMTGEDEE